MTAVSKYNSSTAEDTKGKKGKRKGRMEGEVKKRGKGRETRTEIRDSISYFDYHFSVQCQPL